MLTMHSFHGIIAVVAVTCLGTTKTSLAFTYNSPTTVPAATRLSRSSTMLFMSEAAADEEDLGLTPELARITDAFCNIGDEQVRYKQLLYMAQNTKEANSMDITSKVPENKVPGCLSTVYVDGDATYDETKDDYVINFIGDSDGLLTRGLVALLVRGMSGNTAEDIQKVDAKFIQKAKIEQSLTPGRNNGFLNMLRVMKQKAIQLDEAARASGVTPGEVEATNGEVEADAEASPTSDSDGAGPIYNEIYQALQALKPTKLNLVDTSNDESSFDLEIVADAFDGLNIIKRQQLIYMMLGDTMQKIDGIQIASLTPNEAEQQTAA